jgi:methionine synthase I (cobalamin-dependent)
MIDPAGPVPAPRADRPAALRQALGRALLLLDAAMGTRLLAAGLRLEDDDPCLWNLTHRAAVLAVHRRDVTAGAEAVVTNTFGANRRALARLGCGDGPRVAAINRTGVDLARRAAGTDRFVLGDIGPTAADGGAALEQAELLIEAGVDALLFETHRLEQAEDALRQIGPLGTHRDGVPLLVSLVGWPERPADAIAGLAALGVDALGFNCQNGMAAAVELAERLRPITTLPIIVKPAAGRPAGPQDGPGAFAAAAGRLRALAPVLVGGCCGTTETHLAALRSAWYDSPEFDS